MESHVNIAKTLGGLLQPNQLQALSSVGRGSNLGEAVQQFEAFFIQSMLKSMRSASLSTGLLDSEKSNFYRDWHDQQLAGDLASKETFAVAKLLRRQFGGDSSNDPARQINLKTDPLFQRSAYATQKNSNDTQANHKIKENVVASISAIPKDGINKNNTTLKQLVTKQITDITGISNTANPSTPEQFVQQIYPHAKRAASKLSVSADVLVAIAALETGWGAHTPKANLGQDSFNYFGIKANNWHGRNVTNITKEFDGEKMVTVEGKFRAYETPAESFNDFAEFILSNPRYQEAVNHSTDSKRFVNELHQAGYATDPNYAKKIHSILNGSILKNAIHTASTLPKSAEVVSVYESKSSK